MLEMHRAGLVAASVALVGFGEPLFNSRCHDMARLARELFPSARIFMDTNGNFGDRRATEIADCGLSDIRLGIDGCDQESYVAYREKGSFAKAYAFAGKLADAIRKTGSSTEAVWKYILFRHNDRDEQIALAIKLAADIGMPITFDRTVGHLASTRPMAEIQKLIGEVKIGCNVDVAAYG
jgi:molybdenum cofactor biosynthesis enzyme MoaA